MLIKRLLLTAWWELAMAGLVIAPLIPAEFVHPAFQPPAQGRAPWLERVIPDAELTREERLLWAQLEELDW